MTSNTPTLTAVKQMQYVAVLIAALWMTVTDNQRGLKS